MIRKAVLAVLVAILAVPLHAAIHFDRFDGNHSTIAFRVPIMGGLSEVEGKFTDFDVTLDYDESDVTKSTVVAVIRTASVDTGIAKRDDHLRTSDFFDSAKYPEMRFESKKISKQGDDLVVEGILTLKGVSNPVTLTVSLKGVQKIEGKAIIGLSAKTTIDRRQYGITWQRTDIPGFVGDQVAVEINLLSRLTSLPAESAGTP